MALQIALFFTAIFPNLPKLLISHSQQWALLCGKCRRWVKDYIPELRGEIASGAKHDFKLELKEEEAVLKGILEKLQALK